MQEILKSSILLSQTKQNSPILGKEGCLQQMFLLFTVRQKKINILYEIIISLEKKEKATAVSSNTQQNHTAVQSSIEESENDAAKRRRGANAENNRIKNTAIPQHKIHSAAMSYWSEMMEWWVTSIESVLNDEELSSLPPKCSFEEGDSLQWGQTPPPKKKAE
eukprot:gb/GECH01006432.1/.p1 GENE.gb/GECH01006432.1/~~gb/GECH01006432.1/.p1  ORF type:complete len:163 (+),score=24.22 gb/GECH01006432.1/:1-489(+)